MKFYISAAILCLAINCTADTIEGRVVGVMDGDSISIFDEKNHKQFRIRLSGIDAPEKKQEFGQRSKESLSSLVFGKPVTVETSKQDLYGRRIKVLVNGQDANQEQIRRGMAWHYKAYRRSQPLIDRAGYADAENSARAARRGLWVDAAPVPPWEYRHAFPKSQK